MSKADIPETHDCKTQGCDYEREPYAGIIQVYVCRWCGDEYERDVS